jgi:hypothetical protein
MWPRRTREVTRYAAADRHHALAALETHRRKPVVERLGRAKGLVTFARGVRHPLAAVVAPERAQPLAVKPLDIFVDDDRDTSAARLESAERPVTDDDLGCGRNFDGEAPHESAPSAPRQRCTTDPTGASASTTASVTSR